MRATLVYLAIIHIKVEVHRSIVEVLAALHTQMHKQAVQVHLAKVELVGTIHTILLEIRLKVVLAAVAVFMVVAEVLDCIVVYGKVAAVRLISRGILVVQLKS